MFEGAKILNFTLHHILSMTDESQFGAEKKYLFMIESDRRNFYDRGKSSGDRDAFLK